MLSKNRDETCSEADPIDNGTSALRIFTYRDTLACRTILVSNLVSGDSSPNRHVTETRVTPKES